MKAEALADLLETLVNIPSETGDEARMADWVAGRLQKLPGGTCGRSGNSVVWRTAASPAPAAAHSRRGSTEPADPSGQRPLVVLAGHLDTVPAHGNSRARREGGRIYGVGSSDMKSGDAVIMALLESLEPDRMRFELAAIFYEAEEGPADQNGLKRLLVEMPWLNEARLAILLEPTNLSVELGCNGVINAEVTVSGKSAHSARPWTGSNAVERAVPWLAEITRFPSTKVRVSGAEFVETLQVTLLKAGRARNVVPDQLTANLNYRFPPDRTPEQAEQRLRALVPAEFGFRIVDRAPPGAVCGERPEVREFIDRFGAAVAGKQGWTDVARFTAAGIPAFNFGPGIPEQAHQVDEYCPVENLEIAYQWLAAFLSREGA